MYRILKSFGLFAMLSFAPLAISVQTSNAQTKAEANKSKDKKKEKKKSKFKFLAILKKLDKSMVSGVVSNEKAWATAAKLELYTAKMYPPEKSLLYQIEAKLMRRAGYKVLSAMYSSKAIIESVDKFSKNLSYSWMNLRSISQSYPIQSSLTDLATNVGIRDERPPGWDSDWNYIVALSKANRGQLLEAVREFKKLSPDNRNYFPASYRKAILFNQYSKNKAAIRELKTFLLPGFLDRAPLSSTEKKRLKNLAALALGRIFYEEENYKRSIYYYRKVDKDSIQYPDALFEQSWSLFMNGNPNHALGSLYSLQTPFFDQKYNPETSMLQAIIYFGMCNYDQSRNALADFLEKHQNTIGLLNKFTNNKTLSPKMGYKVFAAGVTSAPVKEIPNDVLSFVLDQPTLHSPRDQLATLIEEQRKLEMNGVFGQTVMYKGLDKMIQSRINKLKISIGEIVIAELRELSKKFSKQMKQAKFLYVELLMSETKEKLGKNLHSDNVETDKGQTYKRLIGWNAQKNMSWASSDKNEVWWDEIGFHIANEESKCVD
jgi:hypothetical protein